jgi:polyribonucleotide nucleotidyltransferase
MMMYSKECSIAGRALKIETGKLANQADSSVTVHYGDTVVLVTTCVGGVGQNIVDFVRLTVDYEERHYAVGKIPGSFTRREARPSDNATLTARLTDRSLRPLMSKGLNNEVQIVITVLSTDQENAPDVLALIGASASLALSSVPFAGPVGAVRIGYIDNKYVVNPTLPQLNDSLIDVVVASTKNAVVMIEAEGKEASEELFVEAIKIGHEVNQEVIKMQEEFQQLYGKPKLELKATEFAPELLAAVTPSFGDKITQAVTQQDKVAREKATSAVKREIIDTLKESFAEADIEKVVEDQLKKAVRKFILGKKMHIDGRQKTEVRPLNSEVGLLPRTHGSGLFSRGRTQVLTITTLGSLRQEQLIDGLGLEGTKRFMHHYNFPPFSTGETKRMGTPGRREIGHGALAERALIPVIPDEKKFSYTIRLVSEVLSSNGSTSMASVCASTLALMDAGVPIKAPVAGIAMGLVTGENNEYVVLTDIEGTEDAYGDMDFKVAGTREGITAIQLDIKLKGISQQILSDALLQAREARMTILDHIGSVIAASRSELSPFAPRVYKLTIDTSKIGALIGPGGKTIRSIIEEAKVTVDVSDDGTVIVGSQSEEAAQKAIGMIEGLTKDVEVGAIYTGKVTRVTNFGAFVEVLPKKEGLVHISELADYRVAKVEDVVNEGDEITVKVIEIDNLGRVNLSRKAVFSDSSQEKPSNPAGSDSANNSPYRPSRPRPGMNSSMRNDARHRPRMNK